jgi:uncharacterized protein (DUF885 family)
MFKPVYLLAALILTSQALAFDFQSERKQIMEKLAAVENNSKQQPEAERLNQLIGLLFDYAMLEFPEFSTYIGHEQGHDRWTDNSFAAAQRREQDERQTLKILETIERDKLTGIDRLNYDLLLQRSRDGVAGQRFDNEVFRVTQLSGPQQSISRMINMMPASTEAQYQNIIARLEAADRQVDQAIAWMRKGLEKGVTPPAITLRNVPEQIDNQILDEPLQSPLLRHFKQFPEGISEQSQQALLAAATAAYTDRLRPAFQRLHDFLVEDYLPGARESTAMKDLPNGEAWYAFNVKQRTTTDLTPEKIHKIGLAEVKRIRGEMAKIIKETGFDGGFPEFFEFLRTDPRFYFTDKEELLKAYRDIAKRADPKLVGLFGRLPRAPYGIVPIPAYAEKSQTTAYYQPGSLEAGRPGQFFANTYALDTRPKWEMEALTLHEAVPGHHFQIAIQQELEQLAWFRRFGGYTAFIEGWGLYAESLGVEMGFYQDPYSKFGQLTYEMWRAVRLVVDTGMHALGWSRQQAIDFFMENTGKSEHDIVVEVDRYIVWPGQALAYKIGELKIKELRARAESKLGDQFDIRSFHDQLLGQGSLPLTVLEQHMDEWIAAQL